MKPIVLALTTVMPGLGQLRRGRRGPGAWFLASFVARITMGFLGWRTGWLGFL